jgi:hypothetical protein
MLTSVPWPDRLYLSRTARTASNVGFVFAIGTCGVLGSVATVAKAA